MCGGQAHTAANNGVKVVTYRDWWFRPLQDGEFVTANVNRAVKVNVAAAALGQISFRFAEKLILFSL